MPSTPSRRHALAWLAAGALPALAGCATPMPLGAPPPATGGDAEAARWLRESAEAHGQAAYRTLHDINVAYDGRWRPLIDRIQPELVDKPWRQRSEERLHLAAGVIAQAHQGPAGRKQVWRRSAGRTGASAASAALAPTGAAADRGAVAVWYAGTPAAAEGVRSAAALVADCYRMFLLGPLWLAERAAARATPLRLGARAEVDGRDCQWIEAWLEPGFGFAARDRVALAVDRDDRTTRRMRFTLEGYAGTAGAVAEVDTFEHRRRHGVLWPTRWFERVVHPLRDFPAHDWHLTGLDVDRGYAAAALEGPTFGPDVARPAAALAASTA